MNFQYIFFTLIIFLVSTHAKFSLALGWLPPQHQILYVSPTTENLPDSSISKSFKSIQQAIDLAQPGDIIVLMHGIYFQDIHSVRDGKPDKPITIMGMPGAIVKGAGKTSIFEIRHSFIHLSYFTIDGLFSNSKQASSYRKKLVYIMSQKNKKVSGIKLLNMKIKNARDECIRLKYQAHNNEIAFSHISYCGAEDYKFNQDEENHNGEAIYIGTAPEQIADDKNPTREIDQSNYNWIHHNTIESYGSECVDIKEGSRFNLIEYNICKYEKDLNVGGISIRGNNNVVRYNHVASNLGAGIRLGGDTSTDGIDNDVYDNYLIDNENSALKIMREPQGKVCDNVIVTLNNQIPIRVQGDVDKTLYTGKCEK